jgi:hypothetical protein|nr:MAG TPA: hypothetical protein [Caudoviricetes sp.]
MYCDTPEVIEVLKNMPPPPTGWEWFRRTWTKLAAETYGMTKYSDGSVLAAWVRGWRGRELHAHAEWGADGRFERGVVVEYAFRDGKDRAGETIFRKEVESEFELADWLMEYGY